MNPKEFDVLITDVTAYTLRYDVAETIGIPYLQEGTMDEANTKIDTGQAILHGDNKHRIIFPCVVGFEDKAHWVFFVVDTDAPLTYLSAQVSGYTHRARISLVTN